MKRELQKFAVDIATKNDLLREIHSVWRNIELDYIRNLHQSITDRLDNVIKMKGRITKYFKVILKLDFPKTVLKRERVKCKQTPPYWKWRILMSPDCTLDVDGNVDVKKIVSWAKQHLWTSITLFGTFCWRPLHDLDMKVPNGTVYGCQHTTANFPFCFFFFKDKYSGYGGQFNVMKLKLAYIW